MRYAYCALRAYGLDRPVNPPIKSGEGDATP